MKTMREIFLSHCCLDSTGRHVGGTDKASNHAYGPAYDAIFPDRTKIKTLLEVGITDGSSMLAWRDAFESALIVGMDVVPCSCERGPRLEFHVGDQRNKADCVNAATDDGREPGRLFDAIIEDAYHSLDNTLLTLFWLWPFVRPGGVYVVEEWYNIGADRENILALFPDAEIIDTPGPFGGIEPLVVFRKKK
jgi:hypothetical protein